MLKKIIIFAATLFTALSFAQDSVAVDSSFGTLQIQSGHPAGVWLNGAAVGDTPFSMNVPVGWAIHSVRAPGHWTEVFITDIKQGAQITQDIQLKKYGIPAGEMPDVSNINDLKTLENLHDSLSRQSPSATPDSICIAYFVADYPLPIYAPSPLSESSAEYRNYYETYSHERQLSFNEFYASCSSPTQQNLNVVLDRINTLGTKQLNGFVPVVAAKFEQTSPDGLKGDLELYFTSPDARADVAWKGTWENDFLTGDALVKALTASEPFALAFLTTQNQTVWIPVEGGYSRHFYKYNKLNISWNNSLLPMEGEFFLPDYIMEQPTVMEWLGKQPPPLALPLDTLPKDTSIKDVDFNNTLMLANIPSGHLKYKNKDMRLGPFSMNTTAINQSLYNAKCGKKDFKKHKGDSLPAHSVTWREASACCAALGGDLPTEAEWEYAARAGSPHKYGLKKNENIKDYAVFNEKAPATVRSKRPNPWGLYDMLGNVAEWVKDDGFWFGKYKFLKGGSWKWNEKKLDIENTEEEEVIYWGTHVGFRCVFK